MRNVATKQQARGSSRSTTKRSSSARSKAPAKGSAKGRPAATTRNRSGGNTTRGATKLTREPVVGEAVKQVFAGHGHDPVQCRGVEDRPPLGGMTCSVGPRV